MKEQLSVFVAKAVNYGIDLTNCKRYFDNYGIKHALARHGNQKLEEKRGQIAITLDDFESLNSILSSPNSIEYVGKNKQGRHCFKYIKLIDNTYYVVKSIRTKKGNSMYFETMYKRKSR